MPDLPTTRFLSGLSTVATGGVTKEELIKYFTDLVKDSFGIERAKIVDLDSENSGGTIGRQVVSARKQYIDNSLSDYSSFAELIGYSNEGFKSYAALPIMADGKAVSMLELLSRNENKFTPEIVSGVSIGVMLLGFALAYKSEYGKSSRLAGYFDAAFNGDNPQMLVSSNGVVAKANKAATKLFGMMPQRTEAKQLLGMDYERLVSISKTGMATSLPVREGGADKTYSVMVSRASEGLLYISMQDISDVSSLRNALAAVMNSDDVFIAFTDERLDTLGVTENFQRILGYDKDMMPGKSISDLVVEKQRADFEAMAKRAQKGSVNRADLSTQSGYPVRMRFSVSKSLNGYAIMFAKADAEKYLQALRESLDDFTANAAEIVLRADSMGYITSCNSSAEAMLNYTRQELAGKEIKALYKDPSIVDRDMTYARNLGKPDNSYVDLIKRDGTIVPGTQSMRLLTDSDGNFEYLVVVKELASKRMMEDQELELVKREREVKKLKSTGDLKSQFIYNISHELKTPLTNIKGFGKLLSTGEFGKLNEEQLQYIQTICDEADRLMLIIQQVLDASKLEAQKVKLDFKEVDLSQLGDNPSIASLRETAEEKGLAFSWKVDYDVPKVLADPNRLIQIFVNLIGNSIKFTDKGGIQVHIFKRPRKKIQCDIIDTGIGISEEDQQKLFKKFYQVPKKGIVKQDGSGTGLGLSITKELVKLHGGDISFESTLGKGSRFWFTIRMDSKTKKGSHID